ncbi:MAG: putative toxin-antitoxin system toxin component, PIN family [Betaproteobacteria bacterium]|nr:putative toxin-antitoxin system toxin component, PIN family [Betaproteobacteria bacterium]
MMRVVLDTNVWLDWLVFDDPVVEPIRAAVRSTQAEIVIDDACEAELARALGYPLGRRTPDARRQAELLAECRANSIRLTRSGQPPGIPLPTCRDPDDQMFLELARDGGARVLVTRDRALLELARPRRTPLPFRIVAPHGFDEWYTAVRSEGARGGLSA